jgi:hypothetical protein
VDLEVDELIDLFFKYYCYEKRSLVPLDRLDSNILELPLTHKARLLMFKAWDFQTR